MARRTRGGSIASLSTKVLQRELAKRHRKLLSLERRRSRLATSLSRLDSQIRTMSGTLGAAVGRAAGRRVAGRRVAGRKVRKRAKNAMNLVQALEKLLKGRTMSVTTATAEVQKAGYKTTAANFRTIVNQTLIKNRKTFRKVSRGQYTTA